MGSQRLTPIIGLLFRNSNANGVSNWGWSSTAQIVLVILMAGAVVLRHVSMTVLGEYFTSTLRTKPDQKVIQTGPYALIRHPGYAANILLVMSAAILLVPPFGSCWVVGILYPIALAAALAWTYEDRISKEEAMLVQDLGEAYTSYQARTARLIPFVW